MSSRNKTPSGCLETLGKKCPSESVSLSEIIALIDNSKEDFSGIFKNSSSDKHSDKRRINISNKDGNRTVLNDSVDNYEAQHRGNRTNLYEAKEFLDQSDLVLNKINANKKSSIEKIAADRIERTIGLRNRLILKYLMLDFQYYNFKDHIYPKPLES